MIPGNEVKVEAVAKLPSSPERRSIRCKVSTAKSSKLAADLAFAGVDCVAFDASSIILRPVHR